MNLRYQVWVFGSLQAAFKHPGHAQRYLEKEWGRSVLAQDVRVVDTEEDRRVVGFASHGNAILETLRRHDERNAG